MTQLACGTAVILALLSVASTAMSQQNYLYSPKTVSAEARANKEDKEILVSEIVIKKGDTLSGLSRKFSGKGSYYPQILLFNDIKNPHLIRTGDLLRVPVKREVAEITGTSARAKFVAAPPSTPASNRSTMGKPVKAAKPASIDQKKVEQQLFDQAFAAYSGGNCTAAITMFDKLLTANPDSVFGADATLYKADCFLKLSGK